MKLRNLITKKAISCLPLDLLVLSPIATSILTLLVMLVTNVVMDYDYSFLPIAKWVYIGLFIFFIGLEIYTAKQMKDMCIELAKLWEIRPTYAFHIISMCGYDGDEVMKVGKDKCLRRLKMSNIPTEEITNRFGVDPRLN